MKIQSIVLPSLLVVTLCFFAHSQEGSLLPGLLTKKTLFKVLVKPREGVSVLVNEYTRSIVDKFNQENSSQAVVDFTEFIQKSEVSENIKKNINNNPELKEYLYEIETRIYQLVIFSIIEEERINGDRLMDKKTAKNLGINLESILSFNSAQYLNLSTYYDGHTEKTGFSFGEKKPLMKILDLNLKTQSDIGSYVNKSLMLLGTGFKQDFINSVIESQSRLYSYQQLDSWDKVASLKMDYEISRELIYKYYLNDITKPMNFNGCMYLYLLPN